MKYKAIALILAFFVAFPLIFAQQSTGLSGETKKRVKQAMDRGIHFLRNSQNEQGNWDDPGITALILNAFFKCHRNYGPKDGPWVRKPLEYLVSCQKPNGGIYLDQLANYNTCVAIMALSANPETAKQYAKVIEKAKRFVLDLQCDEGEGYDPVADRFYGGIGYGGDERPDLSNMQYALEALRDAGLPSDDPALKKAVVFLQRCQNRSESNDLKWAGNDGGFVYYPGFSNAGEEKLADGSTGYRSYGSMTYAGIKSYIYANVKKDDPRVQAACKWIQRHYDLSQNPGVGQQGIYYYYHTFAKTLYMLGDSQIIDYRGMKHNWREDLAQVLLARQLANGSWKNAHSRWWEADPRLVTAYAITALSYCLE